MTITTIEEFKERGGIVKELQGEDSEGKPVTLYELTNDDNQLILEAIAGGLLPLETEDWRDRARKENADKMNTAKDYVAEKQAVLIKD